MLVAEIIIIIEVNSIEMQVQASIEQQSAKAGSNTLKAQCAFYYQGIDECRARILKSTNSYEHVGFYSCKKLVDTYYRCMTGSRYGYSIEEIPERAREDANRYFQCAFADLEPMDNCQTHLLSAF